MGQGAALASGSAPFYQIPALEAVSRQQFLRGEGGPSHPRGAVAVAVVVVVVVAVPPQPPLVRIPPLLTHCRSVFSLCFGFLVPGLEALGSLTRAQSVAWRRRRAAAQGCGVSSEAQLQWEKKGWRSRQRFHLCHLPAHCKEPARISTPDPLLSPSVPTWSCTHTHHEGFKVQIPSNPLQSCPSSLLVESSGASRGELVPLQLFPAAGAWPSKLSVVPAAFRKCLGWRWRLFGNRKTTAGSYGARSPVRAFYYALH